MEINLGPCRDITEETGGTETTYCIDIMHGSRVTGTAYGSTPKETLRNARRAIAGEVSTMLLEEIKAVLDAAKHNDDVAKGVTPMYDRITDAIDMFRA